MIFSDAILKMMGRLSHLSYHYESDPFQRDLAPHALRDGFSGDQIASKTALVNGLSYAFSTHREHPKRATVVGSWFGLTQLFLNEHFDLPCHGIDIQPFWAETKQTLIEVNPGNTFEVVDALDYRPQDKIDPPDLVINTIVEHMDPSQFLAWQRQTIPHYGGGRFLALQSNDMFEVPGHVNCSPDLLTFVERVEGGFSSTNFSRLLSSEIEMPGIKKKRFQWIGYIKP